MNGSPYTIERRYVMEPEPSFIAIGRAADAFAKTPGMTPEQAGREFAFLVYAEMRSRGLLPEQEGGDAGS